MDNQLAIPDRSASGTPYKTFSGRQLAAGMHFWRLTYVERSARKAKTGNFYHAFRCDCGTLIEAQFNNVKYGLVKSCGCLVTERMVARNTIHGAYGNPTHSSWSAMLERCANSKRHNWHLYGGRGIRVCDRWKDFNNFLEDVGERPSLKHSIDRINTDGNYEPSNCRWSTVSEQGRNRRTNRLITAFGRTQPLIAWAEEIGLTHTGLSDRLRSGMPIDRALTLKKKGT